MKPRNFVLHAARNLVDVVRPLAQPVTASVRILLVKEGATLLVYHSYASKWYFPGGGVKRGEPLLAAAVREAREEVGALVRGDPWLLGIYLNDYRGRSDHMAIYVSEEFDLLPPPATWEIEGRAWFALDRLPHDINPGCRRRIGEYLAGGAPFSKEW